MNPDRLGMLYTSLSSTTNRILNLECFVLPPDKIDATTLEEAIVIAIKPLDCTTVERVYTNIFFPLPPRPSIKKKSGTTKGFI